MHKTSLHKPYKYLTFFVAAFITCYLTQEVVLNRLISIGSGYITGGTFIYFISPLLVDVVAEVYGYRTARQMLWCGIFALIFLAMTTALILRAPYPVFWGRIANAYDIVLKPTLYASIVGSIVIFVGQLVNAFLISKWKILIRGKYFVMRSVVSTIIGDSITVILSILFIFAGRISKDMFVSILVPELIIMIIFSIFGSFPAWWLSRVVIKAEGFDNYDIEVNFNPFKFSTDD